MNRIVMGTAVGVLVASATLFAGGHAIAEQSTAALSNLQVSRATLDNGLRVVINQDHTVPTVAVSVYYDVGSRNEVKGRSGFAHLFEHMMFQGSANVGKGEHFSLIINRGGSANGTTSNDRTNYCRRTSLHWGCGSRPTGCARWRSPRRTSRTNG